LKIIGKPNWATELINKKEFGEGEGITFDFKYENDAEFDIFIRNGTWNTSEFKSVGFLIGKYNQSQLWKGKEDGGGRPLQNNNFKLAIDKWFSIAMVVDKDGFFSTILWDKEDPAKMIKIDYHLPEWGEQKWKISSTANGGFYYFDNFSFVNFDEIMN